MITELKIENYKSIQDLTLDVGRVNVLIGENGCGKSNILEAITFAAAAEANKLDNEFLVSRGIRVTEPNLMRSLFNKAYIDKEIIISLKLDKIDFKEKYILKNDNHVYSKWIAKNDEFKELCLTIKHSEDDYNFFLNPTENEDFEDEQSESELKKHLNKEDRENKLQDIAKDINELEQGVKDSLDKMISSYLKIFEIRDSIIEEDDSFKLYYDNFDKIVEEKRKLRDFVIYAPENTTLRNLEKEGQIEPLGINGEGLLKLLTVIQNEDNQSRNFIELNDIKETLELFGWFENIEIHSDYSQLENKITIKDRYLEIPFDQRSANEGFLLVLFYITLVVSKYTPKIFAIDNIDTSLNPKLCTKLIKELARLAKKYDKQLFVTSHNPAILDGIDLGDDEQRLFVVSRNKQGHTRCKRIEAKDKPKSSVRDMLSRLFNDNEIYNKEDILNKFDNDGDPLDISYAFSKAFDGNETYTREDILNEFDNSEEPVKLSYAFLRGYLGGLPKNF